jgi:hypothetical protein
VRGQRGRQLALRHEGGRELLQPELEAVGGEELAVGLLERVAQRLHLLQAALERAEVRGLPVHREPRGRLVGRLHLHAQRVERAAQREHVLARVRHALELVPHGGDVALAHDVARDHFREAVAHALHAVVHGVDARGDGGHLALEAEHAVHRHRVAERPPLQHRAQVRLQPAQRHLLDVLVRRHGGRGVLLEQGARELDHRADEGVPVLRADELAALHRREAHEALRDGAEALEVRGGHVNLPGRTPRRASARR